MKIKAFITHKKAEFFSDCQDRFSINKETKSIALSDGMSQSWHQKKWSELLVSAYTEDSQWTSDLDSVRKLCIEWEKWVRKDIEKLRERLNKGEKGAMHILYRNERNLNNGNSAGATLVGIRFTDNKWSCDVLGDSCLVEKSTNCTFEFRTSQEGEFDNYPDYYDSNPQRNGRGTSKSFSGELNEVNNLLLLVSDPLSGHLLECKKKDCLHEKIDSLLKVSSHEDFENLVSAWRNEGMHNDDTTLVTIEYDGTDDFNIEWEDDIDALSKKDDGVNERQSEAIERQNRPIIDKQSEENKQIKVLIEQAKKKIKSKERDNKDSIKDIWSRLELKDKKRVIVKLNEFLRELYKEFIMFKK